MRTWEDDPHPSMHLRFVSEASAAAPFRPRINPEASSFTNRAMTAVFYLVKRSCIPDHWVVEKQGSTYSITMSAANEQAIKVMMLLIPMLHEA